MAARVADALGAAAATPEHALACWAELAVRESRAVALRASADARAAEMRAEAAAVEARGAALAEALRAARDAQQKGPEGRRRAELEARSVREMEAKRAEYARVVARCERRVSQALAAAGVIGAEGGLQAEQQQQQQRAPLRHGDLQRRAERLAARRDELREAERRAAEFLDLPASVAGARAALEQARERLARSQERLELGLAHV